MFVSLPPRIIPSYCALNCADDFIMRFTFPIPFLIRTPRGHSSSDSSHFAVACSAKARAVRVSARRAATIHRTAGAAGAARLFIHISELAFLVEQAAADCEGLTLLPLSQDVLRRRSAAALGAARTTGGAPPSGAPEQPPASKSRRRPRKRNGRSIWRLALLPGRRFVWESAAIS